MKNSLADLAFSWGKLCPNFPLISSGYHITPFYNKQNFVKVWSSIHLLESGFESVANITKYWFSLVFWAYYVTFLLAKLKICFCFSNEVTCFVVTFTLHFAIVNCDKTEYDLLSLLLCRAQHQIIMNENYMKS